MPATAPRTLSGKELLDAYFLENRARLLEIAAFLDRIERGGDIEAARQDFRYRAFLHGIDRLRQDAGGRTRDLLMFFSDPTSEPPADGGGQKSAAGAWPGVAG